MEEVVVAGGGPAGLAAAVRARQRGFRAVLFERQAGKPDKACGEGLMPSGVLELERLGVRIPEERCTPFRGIRYLQEDGTVLSARFRAGCGLGIRRTELAEALRDKALASGASLRPGAVLAARPRGDLIELETTAGGLEARLLIAADGLHSPLRRAAGLYLPAGDAPPRFGVRRHFELTPWTDFVEVYWAEDMEAYVTPVGPRTVNVALLRDREANEDFPTLLERFPTLRDRLAGAPGTSGIRGAGPLLQRVRRVWAERLALVGDAAGYIDAITGQGLSLGFAASGLLMDSLPADLSTDLRPALRVFASRLRPRWLAYALPAQALVALSRRPALRKAAFRTLARVPGAFGALVNAVG
ncbi:MAG TPA: FAD-dependent monooxygenase [Myxococcales bacterium]|nr:FAD-dependent monooxygenase [Myxococcales bacterium]